MKGKWSTMQWERRVSRDVVDRMPEAEQAALRDDRRCWRVDDEKQEYGIATEESAAKFRAVSELTAKWNEELAPLGLRIDAATGERIFITRWGDLSLYIRRIKPVE